MRGRRLIGSGGTGVLAAGAVVVLAFELPHGALPLARVDGWPAAAQSIAMDPAGVPAAAAPASAPAVAEARLTAQQLSGHAAGLVIGSYQQVLINRDRAAAGRGPLSWSSCLASVAVASARRMAAQGYISHTNGASLDYACHLGVQGGENVGWWSGGVNDAQLNAMFMASADHRANIMGPYHYVATAWAVGAYGYAYIAVEFN